MHRWLYNLHDEERRVGWLELFYDLVFVATLIELGNLLSNDVSVNGFLQFAALFVPIWWMWTGITFYVNRFPIDDVLHRVLIFLQMFAMGIMAISIQGAFDNLTSQFVLAYVAARVILVLLYARAWLAVEETRQLCIGYIVGFGLGALIWASSLLFEGNAVYVVWGIGLLVELGTPLVPYMVKWQMAFRPHREHMAERYGIFTIIVLGESFLKVIDNEAGTAGDFSLLITALLAFAVTFGLWWLYFDDITDSEINEGVYKIVFWIYFHLPLAMGITAFGVSVKKLLEQPTGDPLADKYRLLMTTAVVLYLVAVAIIDEVTTHESKSNQSTGMWRALSAVVVVIVGIVGTSLQPVAFVGLLATVFVLQIALDVYVENNYQRRKAQVTESGAATD